MTSPPPSDVAQTLVEGPWRHRMVAANGARFHVAEAGEGPLVVLLHGFAQFWWSWRHQLPALAAAGYHVVAMDLRGYGASDKPPRGYDTVTLAADVAGVIRALGESEAVVVGHDWGGWIAWAMPSLQPDQTRAVAAVSMPHPAVCAEDITRWRAPRTTARLLAYQLPWLPQQRLVRDGAVARLLASGWGEGSPRPEDLERYTAAMRLPSVAGTALNGFRRVLRGGGRSEARVLREALQRPVAVPVLQLHGARDRVFRPTSAVASRAHVVGPYRVRVVPGAGHLLPEEAPDVVSQALVEWLRMLDGPDVETPSLPQTATGADGPGG